MSISDGQLTTLCAFGFTEVEARFLCLVASHSGYFTARQFLDFAGAKSGKRSARLVEKLLTQGHVCVQRYTRRSVVYQLRSRQIYTAIGKDHLRNRRQHGLLHIKERLLALDFVLAHPDEYYFETEDQKRRYFTERFNLDPELFSSPGRNAAGLPFSDRFPLCIAYPSPDFLPVATFTYIDPTHRNLDGYVRHLRTYRALFRRLPRFQFIYVSTPAGLHAEAALVFSLLVEGQGLADLTRFFDLRTKWDREQYGLLKENDVLFLGDARKRFTGQSIESLYSQWKRGRLPQDLQVEAASDPAVPQKVTFKTMTVRGHDTIFGHSTKNWGDGWNLPAASVPTSPQKSPSGPSQDIPKAANA